MMSLLWEQGSRTVLCTEPSGENENPAYHQAGGRPVRFILAQGGICMLRGEDDYENYFEDTMRAGHYENNKRAVDLMIRSSNDIIRDLLRYHVDFARDGLGNLAFTREGAHPSQEFFS